MADSLFLLSVSTVTLTVFILQNFIEMEDDLVPEELTFKIFLMQMMYTIFSWSVLKSLNESVKKSILVWKHSEKKIIIGYLLYFYFRYDYIMMLTFFC